MTAQVSARRFRRSRRSARFMRGSSEFKAPIDYCLTPGGYRHRSQIHSVGSDGLIVRSSGILGKLNHSTKEFTAFSQSAPPPIPQSVSGGGWITNAFWTNATGNPISSFSTTWTVPPEPSTDSGQLVYIFSGLEDSAGNNILQPVLQWGVAGALGGSSWGVANWYVDEHGNAQHSPLMTVRPGDQITGVITLTDQAGGLFTYQSEFVGLSGSSITAPNIAELVTACETLEAYRITRCSDYPNTPFTAMSNINLRLLGALMQLDWSPIDALTDCAQHTTIVNTAAAGGEVHIYY